jgi:hypothetical protein
VPTSTSAGELIEILGAAAHIRSSRRTGPILWAAVSRCRSYPICNEAAATNKAEMPANSAAKRFHFADTSGSNNLVRRIEKAAPSFISRWDFSRCRNEPKCSCNESRKSGSPIQGEVNHCCDVSCHALPRTGLVSSSWASIAANSLAEFCNAGEEEVPGARNRGENSNDGDPRLYILPGFHCLIFSVDCEPDANQAGAAQ